jgi:hypothetical protein
MGTPRRQHGHGAHFGDKQFLKNVEETQLINYIPRRTPSIIEMRCPILVGCRDQNIIIYAIIVLIGLYYTTIVKFKALHLVFNVATFFVPYETCYFLLRKIHFHTTCNYASQHRS